MKVETKVGLFVFGILILIAVATIRVSDRSVVSGGGYEVALVIDQAVGITTKTPVQIAGVQVGVVEHVELFESRKAKLTMLINNDVILPPDTKAAVKTKGFLGEVYIELTPGVSGEVAIGDGGKIEYSGPSGDINFMVSQFTEVAKNIKDITESLKKVIGSDSATPFGRIMEHLDQFTATLAAQQQNFAKISSNLEALTSNLRGAVADSRENVEESIDRIASITRKIDTGEGTVGKLVNDDETVTKLNTALDSLNNTLSSIKTMETEIGYHAEYMTESKEVKNYVNLTLRPAPDKAFILDVVQDNNPTPSYTERTTEITTGGTTSTVTTNTATVDRSSLRFSAQIAKKFYDFTVRGGIIESRGGFGFDYTKGPVDLGFSAYDFQTSMNLKPHLKLTGDLNITKNIYVTTGWDDFLNTGYRKNIFVGAGLKFVDEDVKSLLGLAAAGASTK